MIRFPLRGAALSTALAFSAGVALIGVGVRPAVASGSGALPGHSGAPGDLDCTACHSTYAVDSGSAVATLSAPPFVAANATLGLTVAVANPQNALKNGFQITARDGNGNFAGTWQATMIPPLFPAAKTQSHPFDPSYHGHTASGNNLTSWSMNWIAPASLPPGPVTFYGCVNDANGDFAPTNDRIYRFVAKTFQASLTSATTTWPVGGLYAMQLAAPGRAFDTYFVAPSEDPTPFDLGAPFELQVNPLTGFTAFAYSQPGIFIDMIGTLDATGAATPRVYVPPLPALSGLTLHFAAVTTTSNATPTEVSNRLTVVFQ